MNPSQLSIEQTASLKPSRRAEHVYAIIRLDEFLGEEAPLERKITVKKIVRDAATAELEVERLNQLQDGAGVRYFSQVTRLEKAEEPVPSEETPAQAPG